MSDLYRRAAELATLWNRGDHELAIRNLRALPRMQACYCAVYVALQADNQLELVAELELATLRMPENQQPRGTARLFTISDLPNVPDVGAFDPDDDS